MKIDERITKVAELLNASPAQVADIWSVSPMRIEKLLLVRRQYRVGKESILQCVERNYGKHTSDAIIAALKS